MSENQQGAEHKNDDLDLIKLFERIFSFCKNYGRLIVLFSIAGIIAGYALYKLSPKQYASSLLLHSFTLSNTELINIIDNWNALLKDKEYAVLAERLNCDQNTVKKISKISASELQKLYISNNPNGFKVEVLVNDNSVLDSLSKRIVYGLENGEYIKAKLASRRSNLMQLIDKVKIEILKLDSTKKQIENSINNNNLHTSSFILDVSNINGQMIGLNEKLLGYQDELKFCNAVQVLHNFEKFERSVAPKLFKSLVLGFIGGFALGYILALYLYLRRRVALHARSK